jgi:hypothetical protein
MYHMNILLEDFTAKVERDFLNQLSGMIVYMKLGIILGLE